MSSLGSIFFLLWIYMLKDSIVQKSVESINDTMSRKRVLQKNNTGVFSKFGPARFITDAYRYINIYCIVWKFFQG